MPGCTDTAPPENYTPFALSRLRDAVFALKRMDTYCNTHAFSTFWLNLPRDLKTEFVYAKWDYVPEG
jgi:hypothetical protein